MTGYNCHLIYFVPDGRGIVYYSCIIFTADEGLTI